MKKILLISGIVVVVVVGWMFLKNKKTDVVVSPTLTPLVSPELTLSPPPAVSRNVITYTDSGYTPSTITIKKGETVTWKNQSSISMWTSSAVHPTHKAYPGSEIGMCGTNTLVAIFDACKGYGPGESWSFKFDSIGTWKYHNHLNSSKFGKIIVE